LYNNILFLVLFFSQITFSIPLLYLGKFRPFIQFSKAQILIFTLEFIIYVLILASYIRHFISTRRKKRYMAKN
jgi:hypothetical protein